MTGAESAPGSGDSAALVLLVDDAPDSRTMYATALQQSGYRVVEAGHGLAALEQLDGGLEPDVLLTDLRMPFVDGIELCRRLKTRPAWRHIPVITLTALPAPHPDVARARAAGAAMVLQLPVVPDRLIEYVRTLLERSRVLRRESMQTRNRQLALRERSAQLLERSAAVKAETNMLLESLRRRNARKR